MKLWDKGTSPDKDIEKFTVGNDYLYDQKLVKYDCLASKVHAKLLQKLGFLSKKELSKINSELNKIIELDKKGKFVLKQSDEDVNTKIENYLTKKLGKTGKKIHTLRSRNDQIMVALSLYSKHNLLAIKKLGGKFSSEIQKFSKKNKNIKMPGYTHMQKAMPSSVSLWSGSFKDSIDSDIELIDFAIKANDVNPLGTGAGYGLPLKFDKKITTKELGFSKYYKNPVFAQNSRSKTELISVFAMLEIMLTLNKLASDLMLFTMQEFGYFELPKQFTTGSSIMPQKKNYDVLEILRSKYSLVNANLVQIMVSSNNLISGYNRDIQLSKASLMDSFEITIESLEISIKLISNLKVNKSNLEKAFTEELLATEKALKLASKGIPFRDAYKEISKKYNN